MTVKCTKRVHGTSGVAKLGFHGAASLLLLAGAALFLDSLAQAQTTYRSHEEAWRVGVAFLSTRNYSASREPLEAALQMTPDDKFRIKVYEALLPAYRQQGEIDKFFDACDFLISESPTPAQQSITRRALLGHRPEHGPTERRARGEPAVVC